MRRGSPAWVTALAALVYLFLHLPLAVLVLFSFNASRFGVTWTGFTLEWYRRLADREDILLGLAGRDGTKETANPRHEPGDPTHPGLTREHVHH